MTEPPRPGEGSAGSAPEPGTPAPASTPYSVPGEDASPDVTPPPGGQYEPPQYHTPQYGTDNSPPAPSSPTSSSETGYAPPLPPTSGVPGAAGTPGYPDPAGAGYAPPAGGQGAAPGGGYGAAPGGYGTPGYGTPGPSGYSPPGYGPAAPGYGYPGAPAGYATSDEKTWALISHFGGPVGLLVGAGFLGWLAPLIALLAKGSQSPIIRAHAVEALNFQITWAAAMVASLVLMFASCGLLFFLPFLVWLVPLIFAIIGGVKANEGQLYHYPMSVRLIK